MPLIPALPPFSLMYWAKGFVGQLLLQSSSFAVSVTTVTEPKLNVATA